MMADMLKVRGRGVAEAHVARLGESNVDFLRD